MRRPISSNSFDRQSSFDAAATAKLSKASFIKEAGVQVERPDAPTGERQEDAAILIAIRENDEIWIDRKETDPRGVRGVIERLHAENPKGSIVIQADENSTNEMLVVVMEAAKQAGVANVAIATDTD